jgi:alkyl sulfatase BDS1-like metallo-beta-lactamase superfamily hydrolase
MMGGAAKILAKGKELYDQGKYREAMEILNKLVYAEPGNVAARNLLADVFEQIGYQKESPSLRNSYLAAAFELRNGMPPIPPVSTSGPDTIRGTSTELWLNFLGIRLDATKAEGMKSTMNLVTPDNGERFVVELSNSTLTNIKGQQAKNPDVTLTINRSDLELVMGGKATLDELIVAGKAKVGGDRKVFDQMRGLFTQFTQNFELMPGTRRAGPAGPAAKDPFEHPAPANTSGG